MKEERIKSGGVGAENEGEVLKKLGENLQTHTLICTHTGCNSLFNYM